jgi:glycosyltransferase involved in cell wall biosynthesis
MKTISILIPTYNEEENVVPLYEAIRDVLLPYAGQYDYEIVYIDNKSQDSTREKLSGLCQRDSHVKAIFNAKNFGQFNSPYYGLCQTTGDCTILMCADFQDPVDMIPKFIAEWEQGYRIVIGIKTSSQEHGLMYFLRTQYYKFVKKYSDVEQIEHFTGFGLYDRAFIEILRNLDDSMPFLRGIVAELGYDRKEIHYEQAKRRAGKTSNNWYRLYDAGMLGITSYTKIGLRFATLVGFLVSTLSLVTGLVYLILKLIYWNLFPAGTAPILIGMFFLGALQLFFIGFLGEYILSINARVLKRPLVIEEQRLNFAPKKPKLPIMPNMPKVPEELT